MAEFKLCIADPKTGKTYQKQVKDEEAKIFLGKSISQNVLGDSFGLGGFEFEIKGGSDSSGFPMRKGILGVRKKLNILKSIGFRGGRKGMRRRKTVCGHKINEKISQINIKVLKEGKDSLAKVLGAEETSRQEESKQPKGSGQPKDSAQKSEIPKESDKPKELTSKEGGLKEEPKESDQPEEPAINEGDTKTEPQASDQSKESNSKVNDTKEESKAK